VKKCAMANSFSDVFWTTFERCLFIEVESRFMHLKEKDSGIKNSS